MKLREVKRAAFAAICSGGLLYGGNVYTWDNGDPTGHRWDHNLNWYCITSCICPEPPGPCYPNTTDDDASIRSPGGPWVIDLTTTRIDALRISEDVTFAPVGASATLAVNMLRIVGPTTVTVTGNALIKGLETP